MMYENARGQLARRRRMNAEYDLSGKRSSPPPRSPDREFDRERNPRWQRYPRPGGAMPNRGGRRDYAPWEMGYYGRGGRPATRYY